MLALVQLRLREHNGSWPKVQQQLSISNDGTGRPAIDAVNPAAVSFDSISKKTYDAKLAWLYNAILKLFQDNVR